MPRTIRTIKLKNREIQLDSLTKIQKSHLIIGYVLAECYDNLIDLSISSEDIEESKFLVELLGIKDFELKWIKFLVYKIDQMKK